MRANSPRPPRNESQFRRDERIKHGGDTQGEAAVHIETPVTTTEPLPVDNEDELDAYDVDYEDEGEFDLAPVNTLIDLNLGDDMSRGTRDEIPTHTEPLSSQVRFTSAPDTTKRTTDKRGDFSLAAYDEEGEISPLQSYFGIVEKHLPHMIHSSTEAAHEESRSLLTSVLVSGPEAPSFSTLQLAPQVKYHLANAWREVHSAGTSIKPSTTHVLNESPTEGTQMPVGKYPKPPKVAARIYTLEPQNLLAGLPKPDPALKPYSADDFVLPLSFHQNQLELWTTLMRVISFLDISTGTEGLMTKRDGDPERTLVGTTTGRAMGDAGALVTAGYAAYLLAHRDASLLANRGSTRLRPTIGVSRVSRPLALELLPNAVADEAEEREIQKDRLMAKSLQAATKRPAAKQAPRPYKQRRHNSVNTRQNVHQNAAKPIPPPAATPYTKPYQPRGGGRGGRGRGNPRGRGGKAPYSRGGKRGT